MHSFIPPERFFPYLTWNDVQAMPDKENVVIIQPVGAIEQHGPHLPLISDRILESVANGWVQVIKDIYSFRQTQPS